MGIEQEDIYYGIDGQRYGPVTREELQRRLREGQVRPHDYVWDESLQDWAPLHQYPELLGAGEAWTETELADIRFAGFGIRLAAHIIDSFVLTVPLMLWFVVAMRWTGIDASALPTTPEQMLWGTGSPEYTRFSMVFYWGAIVVEFAYRTILESSVWQATVGKRFLGMVVVDGAGRRLTFARSARRQIGRFLSQVAFYVGFLLILITEKHQGMHDKLADTFVIRT
jgi:uncharacterized RDD family membrane protein YckC